MSNTSEMSDCMPCPGLYCGRPYNSSSCFNISNCGACPQGYRTDGYHCQPCEKDLQLYDWLYIVFMSLSIPVLHFYVIDYFGADPNKRKTTHGTKKKVWLLHLAAFFESVISLIFTILLAEPRGSFRVHACGVSSIKDWYTLFFNPKLRYVHSVHCTHEAVYPLYTLIFVYLLLCTAFMVVIRGIVIRAVFRNFGRSPFYAGLYILPIIAAIHACLAGVLYYIFPYLVLIGSALGVGVFLTLLNWNFNYFKNLRKPRSIAIMLCYCLAHGFGITSITEFAVPSRDGPLLLLVFLPFIFYTTTMPFTAAANFKS